MSDRCKVLVGTVQGSSAWPSSSYFGFSPDVSRKEIWVHEYMRYTLRHWLAESGWDGLPKELGALNMHRNILIERYQSLDTLQFVRSDAPKSPFRTIHYHFGRSFGADWISEFSLRCLSRYAIDVRRESEWGSDAPPNPTTSALRWVGTSRGVGQFNFPAGLTPFGHAVSFGYELYARLVEEEIRTSAERAWRRQKRPACPEPTPAWMLTGSFASVFEKAGQPLFNFDELGPRLPPLELLDSLHGSAPVPLGRASRDIYRCHPDRLWVSGDVDDLDLDS